MHKKILLAYDGTEEGRVALLECADIAHLLRAETHLLAVMRMPSGVFLAEGFVPETVMEQEQRHIQSTIDDGVALLREGGGSAYGHLAYGEPVEEICRLAAELEVDLIVLGHRKQTSFASRWWKGSVGVSLLERAPCSILVAVGD
ncbi:universal stress protein [Oryzomonas japonica]|uniref:Universal stress protein n=1 Tax=Oryzomonas japonica TaxID=2603858 RepID=A0A7J4ZQA5_9BACT|nr:universal stress protein [Oryzomonas japonica]KAB0665009.1 universal stress protein [Oryzomonas japonica]